MRNHGAEVAALAKVVRSVFEDLATHGKSVREGAFAALSLVERWIGGEPTSVEALQLASRVAFQDGVPLAEREKDRALSWANTAAGNLAWMAQKGRGWKDGERSIVDAAVYALSSLSVGGVRDRDALEKQRREALAEAAVARTSLPAPTRVARPRRVKADLLAFIGSVASAELGKAKGAFDPAMRGSKDDLRSLLEARAYPVHDAVLEFEQRYGGLEFADGAGEEGSDWICGACACLTSEAHVDPRGGAGLRGKGARVPVVYSPNDVIYFLDGHGVAWVEDTIEGGIERFADDADRMMARILLYQIVFARGLKGGSAEIGGKRGEDAAAALGIPPIPEASDDLVHVWGDKRALVMEERSCEAAGAKRGPWKTRMTCASKKTVEAAVARLV